jgi:protein-tyrosine phosphatase
MENIKVLFVCMGNICRSPTAEGVFRQLLERKGLSDLFHVDSAGTHAYHVCAAPDARAQKAARERGIDISGLRARQVNMADFEEFDHILVMDQHNYEVIMANCPRIYCYKVKYFLDFAPHLKIREVPDPYYGGVLGFEQVLDLIEEASRGFLRTLNKKGKLRREDSISVNP